MNAEPLERRLDLVEDVRNRIALEPSELVDVISVTPAMLPSRRSNGAATVAAIVSGSAPGRLADTRIVGKSTDGTLATGRNS